MAQKVLIKEVVFAYPPDVVWAALTDQQRMSRWLAPNDFSPDLEHRFRIDNDPKFGSDVMQYDCEVVELEPDRKMVWSWRMICRERPTPAAMRLEWALTAQDNGATLLRFTMEGTEHLGFVERFLVGMEWGVRLHKRLAAEVAEVSSGAGLTPVRKPAAGLRTESEQPVGVVGKPTGAGRTIRRTAFYPYAPELVWSALTNQRALSDWLLAIDFRPEVGHAFKLRYEPNLLCRAGRNDCMVLELDEPRRMTWAWQMVPLSGKRPPVMTIEWKLIPEFEGTRLVLTQSGIKGQPLLRVLAMRMGWGHMLRRMIPKVLEHYRHDRAFNPGTIPAPRRDSDDEQQQAA